MTETHDNGREEQWRIEGDSDLAIIGPEGQSFAMSEVDGLLALCDYLNELEAARAQAELAQELVDEMRLHPWDFKAKYGRGVDHVGLMSRWDALAAGPTAAAE